MQLSLNHVPRNIDVPSLSAVAAVALEAEEKTVALLPEAALYLIEHSAFLVQTWHRYS